MASDLEPLRTDRFRLCVGDFLEISGTGQVEITRTGSQKRYRVRDVAQLIGPWPQEADCAITAGAAGATYTVHRERETQGAQPVTFDPDSGALIAGGEQVEVGAQPDALTALWANEAGTALVQPSGDEIPLPLIVLARDTDGRATYVREADGRVTVATHSENGATVEYLTAAILYRAQRGPIHYQPGTWQGAVGFAGKIIGVNNAGTFFKWTAAAGQVQIGSTGAIAGTIGLFYVDSQGSLFYCTSSGAALYRSTDDGANWSTVLTLSGSSDTYSVLCEDDLGNLYTAAYGGGASGVALSVNSRKLYKSTDGGANWTDISANMPGGSAAIDRHIHGVWWDDHRKLLIVTHGDNAALSVPYVSDDRGATFSTITGAGQCTAVVATPTHILFAGDGWLGGGDRRIYRVECSDMAGLIANSKTVAYDWMVDGGLAANDSSVNGFAWFGFEDNQGNVVFPYGKEGTRATVIVSVDSGETWAEVLTTAAGRLFHDQCYTSPFLATRDGFRYGYDQSVSSVSQWRVYKPGAAIEVDPSAAPYVYDGIIAPSVGMFNGELRAPGVIQRLAGDMVVPIALGVSGVTLDRRGYRAGQRLVSTPVVSESFEGTPSGWTGSTNGVGSNTLDDTTRAVSGTQSYKSDLSGGSGITYGQIRRTTAPWTAVSGSEIWFDAQVWVAAITTANLTILEWENTRITVRTVNGIARLGVFNTSLGANIGYQQDHEVVAFPAAAWVRVKVAIVAHATNGRVRIWQDTGTGMRLVLDMMGVITDASTIGQNLWIGARTESSGNYTTVWYDDVKLGFNEDPGSPAALTMAVGTALLPDGIYA